MQYITRRFQTRPPKGVQAYNLWLDREDGTKMRLRIYKPIASCKDAPAILWLHGGGYATGTPEMNGRLCKRMIDESGAVIVAPDYRLSVKAPYPATLDDCYAALPWLKEHAKELGARSNQIMVGGESAGGGLTAAVTLLARERKDVHIAFQMPLYPMLDDRMTSESVRDNDAPGWNAHNNREAWKLYLGELYGTVHVPTFAAPARENDYAGLPPAVTFIGDSDPFLDETALYFYKLTEAGVSATCKVYTGCYHGFDIICPNAEISRKAADEFITSFRMAAETYFTER